MDMIGRFLLVCLVSTFGFVLPVRAADFIVAEGGSRTIDDETIVLTTERYDNQGRLTVRDDGGLTLSADVTNPDTASEGFEGLDLGVVLNAGIIDAAQTVHFQEGSQLGGSVFSSNDIVFDGGVTADGVLQAKTLIIAAPERDEDGAVIGSPGTSVITLTRDDQLRIDELLVNGGAEIKVKTGQTLVLDNLVLGAYEASLTVTGEDVVVTGNYRSETGTILNIRPNFNGVGEGSITFLGGGPEQSGSNNIIWQSKINAGKVRVENKTYIVNNLTVQGDFELGADSTTKADNGLITGGRLTLEEGATLRLLGDSYGRMVEFGYQQYNGVFSGGFELQSGATIETTGPNQLLHIAFGRNSSLAGASETASAAVLTGGNILLTGTDSYGMYQLRTLENRGAIGATGSLELIAVNLQNKGPGTLAFRSLKMTNNSVIDLRSSGRSDDGGWTVLGRGGTVDIGVNSKILATGRTVDFGGAAVVNRNVDGGIQGGVIRIGNGGSYTGPGKALSDAVFAKGGTLKLTAESNVDFGDGHVVLGSGSRIELSVDSGYLGMLKTAGTIQVQEGVRLAVANGSGFSGRIGTFEIARGGDGSSYEGLEFEDSLFFELSSAWQYENSLIVEVIKVANLVDFAKSSNQRNLALMIDAIILDGACTETQAVVFDALMRLPTDRSYRKGLDTLSGSVRENGVLFALSTPWRIPLDNIGFQRLSLTLEKKKAAARSGESVVYGQSRLRVPTVRLPNLSLPRWKASHDLWFQTFYHYADIDSDGNTAGGTGHRGGFFLGAALPAATRESLFGVSFGYSGGEYEQRSDKIDLNDYRIGVYGGANLWSRNLQIRGYAGYGFQDYRQRRKVQIDGEGPFRASAEPDGNSVSAAILLIRPIDLSERFLLKPTLGFDFERLEQDGFTEKGDREIAMHFGETTLTRTMLRLGFSGDYAFRRFDVTGRFLYGLKIAGDDAAVSRHSFRNMPAYGFDIAGVDVGRHAFDLGLGTNIGLNATKSSLLFLDYNATFTEHSNSHAGSLGFLWKR